MPPTAVRLRRSRFLRPSGAGRPPPARPRTRTPTRSSTSVRSDGGSGRPARRTAPVDGSFHCRHRGAPGQHRNLPPPGSARRPDRCDGQPAPGRTAAPTETGRWALTSLAAYCAARRARRSDPGVFGTIRPLPRFAPPVSGERFLLDPLGLAPPLTVIPPSGAPLRPRTAAEPLGAACGATGTGRTIGHGHRVSSSGVPWSSPGPFRNGPGQRLS